jgi:ubiquinone/menaquinone biosynthesis C-methylase UbiE
MGAMPTTSAIAATWDAAAATFDTEPDHGLTDPAVRAAWAGRLREWIPNTGADVLDVGCGTGSLALLLAAQGHRVTGVDLSPNMVAHARRKLAGQQASVLLGDATDPPVADRRFDVVLARHLLWTLPEPQTALLRWISLLRPGGHLVLVEGRWDPPTGVIPAARTPGLPWSAGVPASVLSAVVRSIAARVHVDLLTDARLWGREIQDERYALLAHI